MKVRQIEQAWVEAMPKTSLPPKKRLKQWAGSSANWALAKAIDITAARTPWHAESYCAELLRRFRGSKPRRLKPVKRTMACENSLMTLGVSTIHKRIDEEKKQRGIESKRHDPGCIVIKNHRPNEVVYVSPSRLLTT